MSDTTLFDWHFAGGFDPGWNRDIPRFTPDDWHEFIQLAYTAWHLEKMNHGLETENYTKIYNSIPKNFRRKFGYNPDDRLNVVRTILEHMISPLGALALHSRAFTPFGLHHVFDDIFDSDRWIYETRQNFLKGLNLAALDTSVHPPVAYALEELRSWLAATSETRQRPSEVETLSNHPEPTLG